MVHPDTFPPPPAPPRSPWQLLYGAAHGARERYWRRRARRLPRPVVSVGNLHWGGTGKTPLTAALARFLCDRGHRVAILSRGYPTRSAAVRIVSTFREGPLLGPKTAGDEPVELAGALPGVAVVVCPDRYQAGLAALQRLEPPPDLFLLDDGFSHLALERDLDLLAFPLADPFGGGRLAPSGRLREPLSAVRRAHAALLTGAGAGEEGAAALGRALARYGFRGASFAAPTVPGAVTAEDGSTLPPGARVLLLSGIARPERFRALVAALGFEIAGELTFPDHHDYPEQSLAEIRAAFGPARAAAVLTTAKDAVKLRGRLALPSAELAIAAAPEPRFWTWLEGELAARGAAVAP